MKWIGARNLAFGLVLALTVAAPLVAAERTVDVLVADRSLVEFTDTGFFSEYQSVGNGRSATLVFQQLSTNGTDPDTAEVTFDLLYSDGYRASGTGTLMIGSLPDLPASAERAFADFFVLSHLTVTETNQPRAGKWPKVGDQLVGAGEFGFDSVFDGALRVVRGD